MIPATGYLCQFGRLLLLVTAAVLGIASDSALAVPSAGRAELPEGYPATARQKLSFNADWRFQLGEVAGQPQNSGFDDSSWEEVTLPHTLKLTSLDLDNQPNDIDFPVQKTFHREMSWYRRHFIVDAEKDEKVFLEFEGAHQITDSLSHAVGQAVGNSTLPSHTDFTFRANGRDAVTIQFTGEKGRLWLNGLELQEQIN